MIMSQLDDANCIRTMKEERRRQSYRRSSCFRNVISVTDYTRSPILNVTRLIATTLVPLSITECYDSLPNSHSISGLVEHAQKMNGF